MKTFIILLLCSSFNLNLMANEKSHWSYGEDSGPTHWAELDSHNKMCAKGKNQSPINITHSDDTELDTIKFNYTSKMDNIINNGHTVQINMTPGSTINIKNSAYELKQFHFHSPSENHINGKSFPLEAHFVHVGKDGQLAVVAVMFEDKSENKIISSLWQALPKESLQAGKLNLTLTAIDLLPENKDYYRFNGSLTTPPCSEGVRWYVMKNFTNISKNQLSQFHDEIQHDNNRPIQALNARFILK